MGKREAYNDAWAKKSMVISVGMTDAKVPSHEMGQPMWL